MKRQIAVSTIEEADGPTSVFLAGNTSGKKSIKECASQCIYKFRRKRVEKRICAGPHTLNEVAVYAIEKYHAVEIPKTHWRYMEQFKSVKEGLIIAHKPGLLGELGEISWPDAFHEESAKEMYRQVKLRSEKAAGIPDSEMPMDFHIYEIRMKDGWIGLEIDVMWDIFGVSCSWDKKTMKKMQRIVRELYLYYGVSEEDIKNKTKRYLTLVAMLSSN